MIINVMLDIICNHCMVKRVYDAGIFANSVIRTMNIEIIFILIWYGV